MPKAWPAKVFANFLSIPMLVLLAFFTHWFSTPFASDLEA